MAATDRLPPDATAADLGEFGLIELLATRFAQADNVILGPGDDAAVISAPSASVVATTDTLVDGPDFRTAWSSGYDLGWKAAAVNLADVAAMGAIPTALLVALAVPRDARLSFVSAMADGFREACDALAPGCAVVGGDLTVSELLMIAVTGWNRTEDRRLAEAAGFDAHLGKPVDPKDVVALLDRLLEHRDAARSPHAP